MQFLRHQGGNLHSTLRRDQERAHVGTSNHLQNKNKALVIACIWPEKKASAAGVRTWNLVDILQQHNYHVSFISPGKQNAYPCTSTHTSQLILCRYTEELISRGVATAQCQANDSQFDTIVTQMDPQLVLFDRFVTEEQFGWRVRNCVPSAAMVIDSQDIHSLRHSRHDALRAGKSIPDIVEAVPDINSVELLRELAAIHRADHALVVSPFEKELLISRYGVSSSKVTVAPFYYPKVQRDTIPTFEDRRDFIMLGNFRHEPNKDQFNWVEQVIWPEISKQLPRANLNVYGAYPDRDSMGKTRPDKRFFVKGPIDNHFKELAKHKINLAPLRFGAGIKGKIADGFYVGLPCVTTPIGAEGMTLPHRDWGGCIASSADEVVAKAVQLYTNESDWHKAQQAGFDILGQLFDYNTNSSELMNALNNVVKQLPQIRSQNFVGSMLWYQGNRSTEYFSKYLELKRTTRRQQEENTTVISPVGNDVKE